MKKVVFTWASPWNFDKVVIYSDGSAVITDMLTGDAKGYKFKDVDEASEEIGKIFY